MVLTPDSRAPPARSTHEQPAPQQAPWRAPSPVSQENKHHAKVGSASNHSTSRKMPFVCFRAPVSCFPPTPPSPGRNHMCELVRARGLASQDSTVIGESESTLSSGGTKLIIQKRTIPIEYWRPLQSELTNRTTGALNLLFQSHFYLIEWIFTRW